MSHFSAAAGGSTASTSVASSPRGQDRAESRGSGFSSTHSNRSGESSSTAAPVPKVGGVRCYWSIMRPRYPRADKPGSKFELEFLHPDPVLGTHLAKQKMSLMGRGVIEFIHPHEREQARKDLTSAISSDDLQGSVTRVRFARLSTLKIILGCQPEDIEFPDNKNWTRVVEDDTYMVLDLVLNWIGDELLLAFFHAVKDMDPIANNDPSRAHEGWSNTCGSAHIDEDSCASLERAIRQIAPLPRPSRFPPQRVFQLYTSPSPGNPPIPILSWPPARQPGVYGRFDGLYDIEDYAELLRGVNMDPLTLPRNPGEIRTTCTTRFGAQHSLTNEGVYRLVASTFIPYGSVVFACFQTTKIFELPERPDHQPSPRLGYEPTSASYPQPDWQNGGPHQYAPPALAPNMEAGPSTSASSDSDLYNNQHPYDYTGSHSNQSPAPYYLPSADSISPNPAYLAQPQHASLAPPDWPTPSSEKAYHDSYYSQAPPFQPDHSQQPLPIHPDLHGAQEPAYSYQPYPQQHLSHSHHQQPLPHAQRVSPSLPHQLALPPKPAAALLHLQHQQDDMQMDSSPPGHTTASSRPLIRPPGDVECCIACGTRESPEWRRSESGVKDLCNACGLRLARQVAKRDGKQKPRKKKEK